jgi:uncharacterized protein (DUF2384 family)
MTKQQVIDKAIGVIGSSKTAHAWMKVKHPALDGRSPEELLETQDGRYHVWEILCRVERDQ